MKDVLARKRNDRNEVIEWVRESDGRYGVWNVHTASWCDLFGSPQQMRLALVDMDDRYLTVEGREWLTTPLGSPPSDAN